MDTKSPVPRRLTEEEFGWLLALTERAAKRIGIGVCASNAGPLGAIQVAVLKAYCQGAGIPFTTLGPLPPELSDTDPEGGGA